MFRFRTTWGMVFGYFGCIYLTWIYTAWLPGYLEIERHMSVKYTGWAAAIPFACGVVGGILGGYIADMLVRRGVAPLKIVATRPRSLCSGLRSALSRQPVSAATRLRSGLSPYRCSSSMSPALAPGR